MTFILAIVALFIPPLAVLIKEGVSTQFWINLLLWIVLGGGTLLIIIPIGHLVAVFHAFWVLFSKK